MVKKQLRMIRPELTTLPPLRIPRSYGLRTYQVGDDQHWAEIINDSFGGQRTTEDARREIMNQDIFDPEGLFFVTYHGQPIGTACAWRWHDPYEKEIGQLHMVGVHSDHSGAKLGMCVSLAVLHYLREHEYTCAILGTDDFRLPAIKTYLNLGFLPICIDGDQPERWRSIGPKLGLPPLEDKIDQIRSELTEAVILRAIGP